NQQRLVAVGRGAEDIGEEAAVREIPVGFAHFRALWREPFDVIGAVGLLAHDPAVWLQLREAMAKARELADKVGHIVLAAQPWPVDPAGLVVLAVGVVVATLTVAAFVSRQQQRHALCQKQAGQVVTAQFASERNDIGIVRCTFGSAISAEVIIGTVVIVFAIGLVVLLLVADEIIECEAVMHGHVVNAAVQPAAIVLELRGRSGHTVRQIADEGSLAAPEAANGLAVEIVPLRPSGRERADLIAAGTDVPW